MSYKKKLYLCRQEYYIYCIMRKNITLIMLLLLNVILMQAAPITQNEALRKAAEFVIGKSGNNARSMVKGADNLSSVSATLTIAESRDAYYAINLPDNGGYVIVSGDDNMPAVLGYSESGSYDASKLPVNMRSWLDGYVEQYAYLQSHSNVKPASLTAVTGTPILPMLDTHWSQNTPFNDLCPTVKVMDEQTGEEKEERTVTGCVATAMAQIMYYHQWPRKTKQAIPAYTTKTRSILIPERGVTTIDWDNMTVSSMATLMSLCGSSVEMDYNLGDEGGSSSNQAAVVQALVKYFDYKDEGLAYEVSKNYSTDVWNQKIYDELQNGRPVIYGGEGTGGHGFIIDGYSGSDYFHVNWGWGGLYDGYFLLNALNPNGYSFNFNQTAIVGIEGKAGSVDRKYAYAMLEDNILTFYYDNKRSEKTGVRCDLAKNMNDGWGNQKKDEDIRKVVFDPSFAGYNLLTSTSWWFYNCTNLTEIEHLENLNTDNVTDMRGMFAMCESLTSLDLSNFKTDNVTDMYAMFYDCPSLQTIYVKENWNMDKVTDSELMFNYCLSLVGGEGTKYNGNYEDNTYARIDQGKDLPGYFTLKIPAPEGLDIIEANFPDENFRTWLLSQEYGADGVLTDEELENITSINVSNKNIQSLKGIEFFTALTELVCDNNQLTFLDLSQNLALETLSCYNNQLTMLNVAQNEALKTLSCYNNQMTALDVTHNVALEMLSCYNNQLTTIDLSYNTALVGLSCYNNKITQLDVSQNVALTMLYIYQNQIYGEAMDSLVNSLPVVENGMMRVVYNENEENVMTSAQVAAAKEKGWIPYYWDGSLPWKEYAGELETCATPTIDFVDGKLIFSCETEEVKYVYNIALSSEIESESSETDLPTTYIVSAYAKKEGYKNSEIATKEIEITTGGAGGIKGDVNEDGIVNGTDIQEVINIIVASD